MAASVADRATVKRQLYDILENPTPGHRVAHCVHVSIIALILANVVAVVLDSLQPLEASYHREFVWFERVSIVLFTTEYLVRLWVCTVDQRYRAPFVGRLRFALTPLALVDLMAVAPFYVPLIGMDLRVMRTMRLYRLLRLFKLGRYSQAFHAVAEVVRSKRKELFASLIVLSCLLVVASTLMYEAEHATQPDKFSSIPAAMWWGVVTLTAVGYGDMSPVTPIGKMLGGVIAVLGIGMFALPTGIIGAGFIEHLQARKGKPVVCPHCGRLVDQHQSQESLSDRRTTPMPDHQEGESLVATPVAVSLLPGQVARSDEERMNGRN
jgi:voltage-gated potassium channel